jgi:hypothetical protein
LEIWSGGQTGVDRAALDLAGALGIPIGGWIPLGRLAEDGAVPERYRQLRETESPDYAVRTHRNIEHTDATLVLRFGPATGGTRETLDHARRIGRPLLDLDLRDTSTALAGDRVADWIGRLQPVSSLRLNVAGPRASQAPEVYQLATEVLRLALERVMASRLP